jgi:hypothetical protein
MSELLNWLKNWRDHLGEIIIIAGTAGSALTTFTGARKLRRTRHRKDATLKTSLVVSTPATRGITKQENV